MFWPIEKPPTPNRSSLAVGPSTATFDIPCTSSSLIKFPSSICIFLTSEYVLVTPDTDVFVFVPKAVTWYLLVTSGATDLILLTFCIMALLSARVRDLAEPLPLEIWNPGPLCAPGVTIIRFEPIDWILEDIELCAPCPIAVIAMTEAIPIIIPSIVRPDLTLLADKDPYVSLSMSIFFILFLQFF